MKQEDIIFDLSENFKNLKTIIDLMIEKEQTKLNKLTSSFSQMQKVVENYTRNKNDYKRNL